MYILRAADKAHGAHAVAVGIDGALSRSYYARMAAEAEVIVSAEIQHLAPIFQGDLSALLGSDDALVLKKPRLAYLIQLPFQPFLYRVHRVMIYRSKIGVK